MAAFQVSTNGRFWVSTEGDSRLLPAYQRIARRAVALRNRGLSVAAIARHFLVDHRTAAKALRWFADRYPCPSG